MGSHNSCFLRKPTVEKALHYLPELKYFPNKIIYDDLCKQIRENRNEDIDFICAQHGQLSKQAFVDVLLKRILPGGYPANELQPDHCFPSAAPRRTPRSMARSRHRSPAASTTHINESLLPRRGGAALSCVGSSAPTTTSTMTPCPGRMILHASSLPQIHQAIAEHPETESLLISRCADFTNLGVIRGLPRLTSLSVHNSPLDGQTFRSVASQLAELKELSLSQCNLMPEDVDFLGSHCPKLRLLKLGSSGICDRTLGAIGRFRSNLTHLALRSCPLLTNAGVVHLGRLSQLTSLDLRGCDNAGLTDQGIVGMMESFGSECRLTELCLRSEHLGDGAVDAITKHATHLTLLELSSFELGPLSAMHLARPTHLRTLGLSGSLDNWAGAQFHQLARSYSRESLQELTISFNSSVDDDTLITLLTAFPALERLVCTNTCITDKSTPTLHAHPKLWLLDVRDTQLTDVPKLAYKRKRSAEARPGAFRVPALCIGGRAE
eukprot:gnl/Trimastix_PCT/701.p1 GENE.gnl/Trimastix_PCT/701~~gnl/Trimastix_PCT/701.p1  ORF type:complete len:517 (-),score=72.56 gnl/Trimastix_PCT/701:1409-2890(-)